MQDTQQDPVLQAIPEGMTLAEKLIYATAFAAAFLEAQRREGRTEEDKKADAMGAARAAMAAVLGLKLAEAAAEEQRQGAAEGSREAREASQTLQIVEMYRRGFEDEGDDDDDEDEDEAMSGSYDRSRFSPEQQAIIAEIEKDLGVRLRIDRVHGYNDQAGCDCEQCDDMDCQYRDKIAQLVAMVNKVRGGRHDA